MSLAVVFRRAARAEFTEAAGWYERQRPGLGAEFVVAVEQCIGLAAEQPELYAADYHGIRRIATPRFPYRIYFRAKAQRIVILAVFHGSRDPVIWQSRM